MRTKLICDTPERAKCLWRRCCLVVSGLCGRGSRHRLSDSRRTRAMQRMNHDRLGVVVCGRVFLSRQGKGPALGGLVRLEPFVQPPVRDFQCACQRSLILRVGLGLPGTPQDLDNVVKRLQPRLVTRSFAVHEPRDASGQLQREPAGVLQRQPWHRRSMVGLLHEHLGVDGSSLTPASGSAVDGTVCLVDPGLIVGLRQSPMGRHVLGINGERASVGSDRPVEEISSGSRSRRGTHSVLGCKVPSPDH